MSGFKMIRVSLEFDIEQAAHMASMRLDDSDREPDVALKWIAGWSSASHRGWSFTCMTRGTQREYLVMGRSPYLYRSTPKKWTASPVNISGLSIKDRENLLETLRNLN